MGANRAAHLEAVEVGQRQVEQHEVDAAAGGFDRLVAEPTRLHLEPFALERAHQWLRDRRVVLHQQDSRHRRSVEAASPRRCAARRKIFSPRFAPAAPRVVEQVH